MAITLPYNISWLTSWLNVRSQKVSSRAQMHHFFMKNMQKVTAVWSCTSYLLLLDTEGLLIWSSRCAQSIRLEIWVWSSTTNEGNRQAGQTKSWIEKWGSKMCVPKWVKKVIFCTLVRSRFQKLFILTKKIRAWTFWSGSSSLLAFPIGFSYISR